MCAQYVQLALAIARYEVALACWGVWLTVLIQRLSDYAGPMQCERVAVVLPSSWRMSRKQGTHVV